MKISMCPVNRNCIYTSPFPFKFKSQRDFKKLLSPGFFRWFLALYLPQPPSSTVLKETCIRPCLLSSCLSLPASLSHYLYLYFQQGNVTGSHFSCYWKTLPRAISSIIAINASMPRTWVNLLSFIILSPFHILKLSQRDIAFLEIYMDVTCLPQV